MPQENEPWSGPLQLSDIGRQTPVYCCPKLRWVPPDRAFCAATAKLFRCPTELKDLLAGWQNFQTLDDVVFGHRGLPTISHLQQYAPNADSFWSARVIPAIGKGAFAVAHRLQRALLSSDPALAQTRKLLAELAEKGVLISDEQLVKRCLNISYQDVKPVRVGSLGLIHAQAIPAEFDIHLQTYLDHFRENDRKLSVIVASHEDSGHFERRSLPGLERRYNCNITYLDARSRHEIAYNLIRHGIPSDTANFALFGLGSKSCDLGALKNGLLLKCPSQGLMICDVSTVCTPFWHPCARHRRKLRVTSWEVEAYKLFRPEDSLLQASRQSDLVGAHELGLGKPVPQLITDFYANGQLVFESTCEHLLRSFWRGTGHVVATTNGTLSILNHISSDLAKSILTGQGNRNSRQQFSGNSWRGKLLLNSADCYTLGHEFPVGDHSICLDTSANLPPFVPVGEDDQQIFFLTLFCCFPDSYVFTVPCGLPMRAKLHSQSPYDRENSFRLRDLLTPCITSRNLRSENDTISKAIGEGLQTLAGLPSQEFREQVRMAVKEQFERDTSEWQFPSRFRGRHTSLTKFIDRFTDTRNQMIKGSQLFNVSDVAVESSIEDKANAVQEIFMRFGDLLKSWTDILEISTESQAAENAESEDNKW